MANETPRMKITYPSIGEANYFDNYQAGMNDIDAGIFATWSAINTIPSGGGTVTWDLVGADYTLTWTSLIAFQTPAFGSAQSVASGSITNIPKGLLIYTDLSYGATTGSTALTFTVASQVPVDTASLAFAWHNPVTDQLHFATGLVLALGDTATGIQPQGGGGGSISVTDGTTTVNPTTAIDFTAGAVVTDGGGGTAEVLIPLTTKFVVGGSEAAYAFIQDAIDDANAAYVATGVHQVIYIQPGNYLENLVIKQGLKIVGQANPQSKNVIVAPYDHNPAAYVKVQGNHTFDTDRAVVAFHGISFVDNNTALHLFEYADNDGYTNNTIQFYDCSLFYESPDAGVSLFNDETATTANTRYYFERCLLHYEGFDPSQPMFFLGGDKVDFVGCEFGTNGFGGIIYFDNVNATVVTATFTRCFLTTCSVGSGFSYGSYSIVTYIDTAHASATGYCVEQDAGGDVLAINSALYANSAAASGGGIGGNSFLYDRLSLQSGIPISTGYALSNAAAKISYDQVEGQAYLLSSATLDLAGRYDITTVAVEPPSAPVTVSLPNAAMMQGVMFTVWDSNMVASTYPITVDSPTTAGGIFGPVTAITDDGGSLLFVATRETSSSDYCWRVVSYLF